MTNKEIAKAIAYALEHAPREEWEGIIERRLDVLVSECASVASFLFIDDPYALHDSISYDQLNAPAQLAAHTTAQAIAFKINQMKEGQK